MNRMRRALLKTTGVALALLGIKKTKAAFIMLQTTQQSIVSADWYVNRDTSASANPSGFPATSHSSATPGNLFDTVAAAITGQSIALFPNINAASYGINSFSGGGSLQKGLTIKSAIARFPVTNHPLGVAGRSTMCPPESPAACVALGMAQVDQFVFQADGITIDNIYVQPSAWGQAGHGGNVGCVNWAGASLKNATIKNCRIRHGRAPSWAYVTPGQGFAGGMSGAVNEGTYNGLVDYDLSSFWIEANAFSTNFIDIGDLTHSGILLQNTGGDITITSNTITDVNLGMGIGFLPSPGNILIKDNLLYRSWSHKIDITWSSDPATVTPPTSTYIGFNVIGQEIHSTGAQQTTKACTANSTVTLSLSDTSGIVVGMYAYDSSHDTANIYQLDSATGTSWLPAAPGLPYNQVASFVANTSVTLVTAANHTGGPFNVIFFGDVNATHEEITQFNFPAIQFVGNTHGTNTIDGLTLPANMVTLINGGAKYAVTGLNIASGTFATAATSTSITISPNATGSATGQLVGITPVLDYSGVVYEGNILNLGNGHPIGNNGSSDCSGVLFGSIGNPGSGSNAEGNYVGAKIRGNLFATQWTSSSQIGLMQNMMFYRNTIARFSPLNTQFNVSVPTFSSNPFVNTLNNDGGQGFQLINGNFFESHTLAEAIIASGNAPDATFTANTHSNTTVDNISPTLSATIVNNINNKAGANQAFVYVLVNNNYGPGDIPNAAVVVSAVAGGASIGLLGGKGATGTTTGATYQLYLVPNTILGLNGGFIPYGTAFQGPFPATGVGTTVASMLSAFAPQAGFANYGAIGYADFVNMTVNTNLEPTVSLFNAKINQIAGNQIFSNISAIRGGPTTITATLTGTGSPQMQVTTDFAGTNIVGGQSFGSGSVYTVAEGNYIQVRLTAGTSGVTRTATVTYTGTGLGGSASFSVTAA